MSNRPRVIIASPDPFECGTLADWLRADNMEPVRRMDPVAVREELRTQPFDLLVADERFIRRYQLHQLSLARRPLTPTIVIGNRTGDDQPDPLNTNIVYLSRPLEQRMFLCTVALGIADGRPIRRSERKLVRGFKAVIDGRPSYLVDVSNEGLRIEIPRDGRPVPLPYFNVLIPLVGVAVTVQRMWTKPVSAGRTSSLLCGGALVGNQSGAEQAWRGVVETISVPDLSSTDATLLHR